MDRTRAIRVLTQALVNFSQDWRLELAERGTRNPLFDHVSKLVVGNCSQFATVAVDHETPVAGSTGLKLHVVVKDDEDKMEISLVHRALSNSKRVDYIEIGWVSAILQSYVVEVIRLLDVIEWPEVELGPPHHSAKECNDALCSEHGDPRDAYDALLPPSQ